MQNSVLSRLKSKGPLWNFKFLPELRLSVLLFSFFLASTPSKASIIVTTNPFSSADQFGLSPFWKWKTIESDHFRISFPMELRESAIKSMNYFEEAHRLLSPLFQWEPRQKTQILIIDNMDSENGVTSPFARFGIILWITPPDYWYGSGYYDDWLRLVVIHEYTHFLNMDTTDSFWKPLRSLFGDSLLPNTLWPPWMLEGLAVYMETSFTKAGRGRSPYYQAVSRGAVEEGVLNTSKFITLDQLNANLPYFPKGDTRYIFGYNLMNQVAQNPSTRATLDSHSTVTHNEHVLGTLSKKSGSRIPFFINSNLQDITNKDWYDFWKIWVEETQTRATQELEKIKSQPLSQITLLTEKSHDISNDITGVSASPDGKWLAYTLVSADRRQGLYLRNTQTGKILRLLDKYLGIGLTFTPDSRTLIYSRMHQSGQYSTYSDLEVYDLESKSNYWLTVDQRTRDPHISRDGKWITFTLTRKTATGLAIAPLFKSGTGGNKLQLGEIQELFMPPSLDRVGNPQFSADGSKIFFSYHANGKTQEDILEFDRQSHSTTPLVADGNFNRFPVVNEKGDLFFISDKTRVDNLYRYEGRGKEPSLVTNVTTGLNYPHFGPSLAPQEKSTLYGGVLSYSGWNLCRISLLDAPINPKSVTLSPPLAPEVKPDLISNPPSDVPAEQDYSPFPSVLPRIWSPLLGVEAKGVALGAEVFGFDAINVHRYLFAGAYNTNLQVSDWAALYSNRSLGPALSLQADLSTTYIQIFQRSAFYSRKVDFSASAAYPFLWTYSSLTPSIALNVEQYDTYRTGSDFSQRSLMNVTPFVPSINGVVTYSDLETSSLSLVPEDGFYSRLGVQVYLNGPDQIWKALLVNQKYLRITKHTVLSPSLKGTWVSSTSFSYPQSGAFLEGRSLQTLVNPFPSDNFNQLAIRGYPNFLTPSSRFAGVAALDLWFPIARIFRGAGTNPLFLNNLYGFAFSEMSYYPSPFFGGFLPSVGTGLRLSTDIFFIPLTLSSEYHYGFRRDKGGSSDLFFTLLANGISF